MAPRLLSWSIPVGPQRDPEPAYSVCSTRQRAYVKDIIDRPTFAYATYNPFTLGTPYGDLMFTWRNKNGSVESRRINDDGVLVEIYKIKASRPRVGTVFAE